VNAPHVKVAVVMPGPVATDIVRNSLRILGADDADAVIAAELDRLRAVLVRLGAPVEDTGDDDLRRLAERILEDSGTTAAEAATTILDGLRAGRWRILVGDDAHRVDEAVRANPEAAYGPGGPSVMDPAAMQVLLRRHLRVDDQPAVPADDER
jgi:hypothetical protein